MVGLSAPDGDAIMRSILSLEPGEAIVYYEGLTGWMYGSHALRPLQEWFEEIYYNPDYIFTQRRIPELSTPERGIYEYIAIRKTRPKLVRK